MKFSKLWVFGVLTALVGCSSQTSMTKQEFAEQKIEVEEIKNGAIEDHLDEIPSWVTDIHSPDDVGMYAVGIGESFDLSIALKKSTLDAEFNLAKVYAQELSGTEKMYIAEMANAGNRYQGVIEKLVTRTPVVGYRYIKKEVKAIRGKYYSFVLLQLPYDEFNEILSKKKEAAIDKDMKEAFKQLEKRLNAKINQTKSSKTASLDKKKVSSD